MNQDVSAKRRHCQAFRIAKRRECLPARSPARLLRPEGGRSSGGCSGMDWLARPAS
ncbi:MAG: hypothetical protein GDA41_11065 [Rhodospirillales bacterium]|nr:hypothetical protein [Rhodospirillales bacterium]